MKKIILLFLGIFVIGCVSAQKEVINDPCSFDDVRNPVILTCIRDAALQESSRVVQKTFSTIVCECKEKYYNEYIRVR